MFDFYWWIDLFLIAGLCAGIHGEQNTGKTRMKENKWRPVFTDCSPAFLKENSALRTYVTQVKAVDSDSEGQIRYQMVGLENKLKFKVDEFNGTITSDFVSIFTTFFPFMEPLSVIF